MMKILLFALLACLVASQTVTQCPANTTTIKCSNVFAPVCGVKVINGYQIKGTFQNWCQACINGMEFTVDGKCEDLPCNVWFCSPAEKKNKVCTKQYDPYCAWFGNNVQCLVYPCAVTAGNKCMACGVDNVLYVTQGVCPSSFPKN